MNLDTVTTKSEAFNTSDYDCKTVYRDHVKINKQREGKLLISLEKQNKELNSMHTWCHTT
jgi:hypothetical protein